MNLKSWTQASGKAGSAFVSSLFSGKQDSPHKRSDLCYHLFSMMRCLIQNREDAPEVSTILSPMIAELRLDKSSKEKALQAMAETDENYCERLLAIRWIHSHSAIKRQAFELLFHAATDKIPMSNKQDAWILLFLETVQLQSPQYLKMRPALLDDISPDYNKLELANSCSDRELKNKFRELCHKNHPDKGGDPQEFTQIQKSYQTICQYREPYKILSIHDRNELYL